MSKVKTLLSRFLSKVEKTDTCWLWRGCLGHGYGRIGLGRASEGIAYAHRVSWVLAFGPIPDGLYVCHTCDVRACVNPAHLFLGSQKDNMQDAKRKGRIKPGSLFEKGNRLWETATPRKGDGHPNAKVTTDVVKQIRALRAENPRPTHREIASRFGISASQVSRIALNQRWANTKV